MRKDKDLIAALVKVLTNDQESSNGRLPARYQGNGALPTPQRPGLLTRWLDRTGTIQDEYALEELRVVLKTHLKSLETQAAGELECVQLTKESAVRVHSHRVAQRETILKKEVEAEAQIDLHVMQQRLIEQVADLGLDPTEEAFVIAKIVAACMGKENNKENHHGHK